MDQRGCEVAMREEENDKRKNTHEKKRDDNTSVRAFQPLGIIPFARQKEK